MDFAADRKLLVKAAKAMGLGVDHRWNRDRLAMNPPVRALVVTDGSGQVVHTGWDPLEDDGPVLWMVVHLHMGVKVNGADAQFDPNATVILFEVEPLALRRLVQRHHGDPAAATRRAVVRAAAQIYHERRLAARLQQAAA